MELGCADRAVSVLTDDVGVLAQGLYAGVCAIAQSDLFEGIDSRRSHRQIILRLCLLPYTPIDADSEHHKSVRCMPSQQRNLGNFRHFYRNLQLPIDDQCNRRLYIDDLDSQQHNFDQRRRLLPPDFKRQQNQHRHEIDLRAEFRGFGENAQLAEVGHRHQ